MSLVVMGATYKTVPLDALESAIVPKSEIASALGRLVAFDGVEGAVVLSTCNRVEAYVDALTEQSAAEACCSLFGNRSDFSLEKDDGAVQRLFRIACSLDSQVLGDAQILGQVKEAYQLAEEAGTCTEVLTKLFKDALSVGKRARSETAIGSNSVSLSSVAVKAAADGIGSLEGRRVLLVGSGEVARLTMEYLKECGASEVFVTSRTKAHARSFAQTFGAQMVAFEDRYVAMANVDVVFSMTSASNLVIQAKALSRARQASDSSDSKLVIVDEAMPRDAEPACADLPNVQLYDLESLSKMVDEGVKMREAAIGKVEVLIAEAEHNFLSWMRQRSVVPTIRDMYAKGSAVVDDELVRAVRSFAALHGRRASDEELEILQAFGNAVMKKMLHGPTALLRQEARVNDSQYYANAARYLFGLDTYPTDCMPHACAEKPCLQGWPCSRGLTT